MSTVYTTILPATGARKEKYRLHTPHTWICAQCRHLDLLLESFSSIFRRYENVSKEDYNMLSKMLFQLDAIMETHLKNECIDVKRFIQKGESDKLDEVNRKLEKQLVEIMHDMDGWNQFIDESYFHSN